MGNIVVRIWRLEGPLVKRRGWISGGGSGSAPVIVCVEEYKSFMAFSRFIPEVRKKMG
jgi:hypothetical protein